MPRREKLPLLQRLSHLTPHILFGDVNWTDELPKDDPELAYVTAKGYGLVFADILASPTSPADQRAAIYQFLLPEAISVLKEEIGSRTDYHITMDDWNELAAAAGFVTMCSIVTTKLQGYPVAFAATWRSRNCK